MASKVNSKSPTIRRILREAQELAAAPSGDFAASPLETDLFEWHFTLRGPPNSAYSAGVYHGRIVLPATYPLRPPSFRFLTPSGRFEANREICLSISGHHEETWQPAWGLRTALVALRAFMETDARGQVGGLDTSDAVRRRFAAESPAYRCPTCGGRSNAEILQESSAAEAAALKQQQQQQQQQQDASATKPDDVVPPELRIVFRDELDAAAGGGGQTQTGASTEHKTPPTEQKPPQTEQQTQRDQQAPQPPHLQQPQGHQPPPPQPAARLSPTPTIPLAEVATAPSITPAGVLPSVPALSPPTHAAAPPRPAPGAAAPAPTATVRVNNRRRQQQSADAVPVWVDRSIVVLCVVLVAMVLRMLLA